jgi:hypothetical protein
MPLLIRSLSPVNPAPDFRPASVILYFLSFFYANISRVAVYKIIVGPYEFRRRLQVMDIRACHFNAVHHTRAL